MPSDGFERRKKLTFAQAEGVEPLPRQLSLMEISPSLRARLWLLVHDELEHHYDHRASGFEPPWSGILWAKHVHRDHKMIDEFKRGFSHHRDALKQIFEAGDYVAVFDFLQWLLRLKQRSITGDKLNRILEDCRSPYRVLDDGETIVPIASEEEGRTLERAFSDLGASELSGARAYAKSGQRSDGRS